MRSCTSCGGVLGSRYLLRTGPNRLQWLFSIGERQEHLCPECAWWRVREGYRLCHGADMSTASVPLGCLGTIVLGAVLRSVFGLSVRLGAILGLALGLAVCLVLLSLGPSLVWRRTGDPGTQYLDPLADPQAALDSIAHQVREGRPKGEILKGDEPPELTSAERRLFVWLVEQANAEEAA